MSAHTTPPPEVINVIPDAVTAGIAASILRINKEELLNRTRANRYQCIVCSRGWKWYSRAELVKAMGGIDRTKFTPPPPRQKRSTRVVESAPIAQIAGERKPQVSEKTTPLADIPQSPELTYSGEEASRIFKALEEGISPVQIVIQEAVHPSKVNRAEFDWRVMKGHLWLSSEALRFIEALPLQGERPIRDEAQLVRMLEMNVKPIEPAKCGRCMGRPARICADCANGAAYAKAPDEPAAAVEPIAFPSTTTVPAPVAEIIAVTATPLTTTVPAPVTEITTITATPLTVP